MIQFLFKATMIERLHGIIFVILLFISSFLGSIFVLFPFIPLAFFAPRTWRICADRFVGYWLVFPTSMLFFIFRVKFRVTGDLIDRKKPALIIMNHRTRLDWLFFWNALYKMDPWLLTTEKISLKSSLKKIPGAGWAMGCGAFIFMNRNYEQDHRILSCMLKYYKNSLQNYQLLFFPEGTDRGERATEISNSYADKNGFPRYDYVLHPRTTGFNYIVNRMKKDEYIDYVYDVTVSYPERIVSSEMMLLKEGKFPEAVHFDIRKYKIGDIVEAAEEKSDNELDCSAWLKKLWAAKEERLRQFYSEPDPRMRRLEPSGDGYVWPMAVSGSAHYVAFGVWLFFSLFWCYWLVVSTAVRVYAMVAVAFYAFAERRFNGVDFLSLEWFYGQKFFLAKNEPNTTTS